MTTAMKSKPRKELLAALPPIEQPTLKLDFGCGPNPREGFEGVDILPFGGKVKHVLDIRQPWPWGESTVAEAHASHLLEHLTNFNDKWERVHFFNELWRVLVPGGKATIIIPHWCSNRYYGDPTHKEPFSEMGFYYLLRAWRLDQGNAPHDDISNSPHGYSCDFDATWGYNVNPNFLNRNQEAQQFALSYYKEAAMDLHATLTAKK